MRRLATTSDEKSGLAGYGVRAGRPLLPLLSAVLMAPFGYYLAGAQNWLGLAGPGILLGLIACAYATRRGLTWLAWCLLLPFLVVFVWLAFSVIRQ